MKQQSALPVCVPYTTAMDKMQKRTSKTQLADSWCWRFASEEDRHYHDSEWGVPVHDDARMFEHLSLECLQCGLSWDYVLQRRALFREAFHGFDIDAVASMTSADIERALEVPGILRSPRKLFAIVNNAQHAQELRAEFGSFSNYFWNWTDGKTVLYAGHQKGAIPAYNALSTRIAKDLKKRGFTFVGPTNIYAHLQACGIVCDHNEHCERYVYITQNFPCIHKHRDGEG
ncbi:MAG: DNA-3-methyladenine glycosylase I [Eggerthellaceae bacterium]|nr:DNA-3-methyladenine glycosylase I [Eggerthellaceae bacterium]